PKPAPKPQPPASAAPPSGRVTAGLYGGSSVPTIRESDEPRPRAAAVQLNASGSGGRVLGAEEEDEPIEVGAADFETDLDAPGGGFSVKLQQFAELEDDDDEDASEISAEDLEVIRPNPVAAAPPTAEEIRQMVLRAQNATASGQLQNAADLYSDVVDADPDNVPAHVARGRLYLDLGDYSRAMSDFMVAEDIAPNDPEPQVAIGDLYFARKDYAKAIEYFDDALRFSPNHPMAHCRRGISHYYRKNYREAVDDLLRAERLDPDIPNIQTYVAMAKKKVKR
ncbi:MAG: tetratricopeptide repeat protein, partial [Myxococcota bacterium]